AMACGCPVISSDRTSLQEVGGDAFLYIDPDQPIQIANHIKRLLNSPTLREEIIKKGYTQSANFTWKNALDGLLANIEDVRNL
ncbi:glycosyltransferase, partial [Peribacillus frigoritolerans]